MRQQLFGVGENGNEKQVVGSAFKTGNRSLLEKFKYEIAKNTTNGMTFYDIIELFPVVDGVKKRVLMFKIPAATTGIPTDWKNNYYERSGESLVPLKQYKIDAIRSQVRRDWSKQVIEEATIDYLDKAAISLAREKYKEKMAQEHIAEEVNAMDDGASYIKNRGFDDKYYKDLILEYLKKYKKASKKDIKELLWDKLPNSLSDKQKESKLKNLLSSLRMQGKIESVGPSPQRAYWILVKNNRS